MSEQPESKQLTPRGQMLTTLNQRLGDLEPKLAALLPKYLPAKRFWLIAYDSVTRTPLLQECTIPSILKCVIEAGEAGLEVGGPKKHAWLIPLYNSKTKKMEAHLWPGYMGLAHLAYDAGGVKKIEPHKVYARDHYVPPGGPDSPFEHVPFNEYCSKCGGHAEIRQSKESGTLIECPDCKGTGRTSRGRVIAYYTVAILVNGELSTCHMTRAEVEAIRQRSRAKDRGPWVTDYDEMGLKTCFKRHEKFLPKTDGDGANRLARAIEIDNQTSGLEDAANAGAIETTSRPLPHEILEEEDEGDAKCAHGLPLDQKCKECEKEKSNKGGSVQSPAGSAEANQADKTASADSKQTPDKQADAVGTAPTSATQTEMKAPHSPGGEQAPDNQGSTPSSDPAPAHTEADEAKEPINPQRLNLLAQTLISAGIVDQTQIAEMLKPFGVSALEEVTNGQFSDVLARFAKLPLAKRRK